MFAKGICVLFALDAVGIRILHRAPHSSRTEHNTSGTTCSRPASCKSPAREKIKNISESDSEVPENCQKNIQY
jgi:hypothetical protein